MEWLSDPESWIALITLIALELVLGVDNVIFISILSGKLPPARPTPCPHNRHYAGSDHTHSAITVVILDHQS